MFRNLYKNFNLFQINRKTISFDLNAKFKHKISENLSEKSDEKEIFGKNNSDLNAFVNRSHTCGQLTDQNVGQSVRLFGWIQYQRLGKFATIRDSYGLTQIIVENDKRMQKTISKLMPESVVEVKGRVARRPDRDVNTKLLTGSIEVIAEEVNVLNDCRKDIPFIIRDYNNVNEKTRLQFRYIDLRHPRMQEVLRLRSRVVMKMRQFLADLYGFVEVETPTLFKPTPGGAKEFVVPTQFRDCFYNLVQSPQQFKQLLMIGAIDRYFQIARCYRDEGTRPDRQPEFTQLDLEMSFTTSEGIMSLIEELIQNSWPNTGNSADISLPFARLTYADSIKYYGTDKPDLRSDIKLKDIDLRNSSLGSNGSADDLYCLTLAVPDSGTVVNQKLDQLNDEIEEIEKQLKFNGNLFYVKFNANPNNFENLDQSLKQEILNTYELKNNHFLWVAIGSQKDVYRLMGRIRADCVSLIEESKSENNKKLSFLWITDFPLFMPKEETVGLESSHHPFTAPQPQDSQLLYSDPVRALGQHFDLVLNGQEVGGGSIRIHDHKMQEFVLKDVLKEDIDSMQYFLDALRSGCPPHGGIALGLDRLIAIMCGTQSIRDVMAFPKSAHGKDLMAGSPAPIADSVKQLYHLR